MRLATWIRLGPASQTGRPLGPSEFVKNLEHTLHRSLTSAEGRASAEHALRNRIRACWVLREDGERSSVPGFSDVHLILTPRREDSLAVLLRRLHGRYAQHCNARHARSGHLWQNRFFACAVGPGHLWTALAYVDNDPVRAGLVKEAGQYRWSSAAAHMGGPDSSRSLDIAWWRREAQGMDWGALLAAAASDADTALRRCTYAGRPYGDTAFVDALSERFGRCWVRGRPRKKEAPVSDADRSR